MTTRNSYPGGRTRRQWRGLTYKQKHRLVTAAQCDVLALWSVCNDKRCRRQRSCLGNPFDCFWKRREAGFAGQFAAEDKKLKPLAALLNV